MEEFLNKKFTKEIISESANRYTVAYNNMTLVGNHQNHVFKANSNSGTIYIRITHESHRDKDLIQAEIEWIHFLSSNGILVALNQ